MQSLAVFGGVDSRYTSVRRLDVSRLSKALISKKWHDCKYEIFTTFIYWQYNWWTYFIGI